MTVAMIEKTIFTTGLKCFLKTSFEYWKKVTKQTTNLIITLSYRRKMQKKVLIV